MGLPLIIPIITSAARTCAQVERTRPPSKTTYERHLLLRNNRICKSSFRTRSAALRAELDAESISAESEFPLSRELQAPKIKNVHATFIRSSILAPPVQRYLPQPDVQGPIRAAEQQSDRPAQRAWRGIARRLCR